MQKTYDFILKGGLDLTTPAAVIKPGRVIGAKNYEPDDEGGYRRLAGYERFDGQPSPSDASYWYVTFDAGSGSAIVATDIVTGGTSGVTSEVLSVVLTSGAWGVDAAGYLVVFNATGLYTDGEDLDVSTTRAVADGASFERPEIDPDVDETNLRAAIEATRADIGAVPGSGDIHGVRLYNGVVYAFRDNAGATACIMYASSGSGLTVVDLGDYIDYTTGAVTSFVEGEVVTQAVSGATGVVVAVGVTSGSFTGGDALGRLYLKSVTGVFDNTNALSAPSTATGVSASVLTAVTIPPGGKFEFYNYNFGGSLDTRYMWGVNGVGRGLRFDGTDFAYVHVTGLTEPLDKPQHLHAHKKHLFYSFGSSVQHSSTGEPMIWNAITGANEIATGDTITSMQDQPGDVLGIFNRNRTYMLYGDDVNNWDLNDYSLEKGAIEWSVQDIGYSIYFDDRGISKITATDQYGDFSMSTLSESIDPLIQAQKVNVVDSIRIKSKNQYRVFFQDKTGVLIRFDKDKKPEFMPFELLHRVSCIDAEEDSNGIEQVYFGSDDGYIYQAEKGESFDGELIEYFLRFPFCHCKSPRQKKRFHKAVFQVDSSDTPNLTFNPEFSYGSTDQPPSVAIDVPGSDIHTGGGYWDTDFWGEFIWDGQPVGEAEAYFDGEGINVSMQILGSSNFERQHTFQSCTYNYSPRGLRR